MPKAYLSLALFFSLGGSLLQAKNNHQAPYHVVKIHHANNRTNPLGRMVEMTTADGVPAKAYYIPSKKRSNKYVIVFHEWWGLNDHVKKEAELLYHKLKNTSIIAVDLYDGKSTTKPKEASALMIEVDENRITNIINAAFEYAGKNAIVATYGWGLGGSYSLKTAINHANQVKACVVYYGMPELDVQKLKQLSCEVLGIFGTNDQLIDTILVKKFETQMQLAQKKLLVCYYPVGYAFVNPANDTFSPEFAKHALNKSVQYINKHLYLKN